MPVLVVTITPKAERIDDVENVFKELANAIQSEDGCELYALHRGKDRLILIEKWRDGAALRVHGGGENLVALNERLEDLIAEKLAVQVLEAVPLGDTGKGSI